MIGDTARVMETGAKRVKVLYRGEIWDATYSGTLLKDEPVEITGFDHMKLLVRPRNRSELNLLRQLRRQG